MLPRKAHVENDARGKWHALRNGIPQGVKLTDNQGVGHSLFLLIKTEIVRTHFEHNRK